MNNMTRISGSINTPLSTLSHSSNASTAGKSTEILEIGQQVQQSLFGKPKPKVVDPALFPHLAEQLTVLKKYKRKNNKFN